MLRKLAAALALVVAISVTGTSAAASAVETLPSSRSDPIPSPSGLVVPGTHGFRVAVEGSEAEAGTVTVIAEGKTGEVGYGVAGSVSSTGIEADLGRFGRIDLSWVPDGNVSVVHGRCGKRRTTGYFADGSYIGTLRLRGGGGFTSVDFSRVRFRPGWFRGTYGCMLWTSEGYPGPGVMLEAQEAGGPPPAPVFSVLQNHPGGPVHYQAEEVEREGAVKVFRAAYADAGAGSLQVAHDFSTAEIDPPAPFSGTASFQRTKHAQGTLRGDLHVDFPDGVVAHLAGSSFKATLHSGERKEFLR